VGARARIVSNPDTEVLHLERALLVDHIQTDDFTIGLLDLSELHQEVPETGFCNHGVGCKNPHAIELWSGVGVGGQVAPNDLILCETTCKSMVSARELSLHALVQILPAGGGRSRRYAYPRAQAMA